MQERMYNPELRQQQMLAAIDAQQAAKQPVRIASGDHIGYDVPPQGYKHEVTVDKSNPNYDTTVHQGKVSRVKVITVDDSSDLSTWNRMAGHSVIQVDGIVYNFTPGGFVKIDAEKYFNDITNQKGGKPSQGALIQDVQVTDKEVERIKAELKKTQGDYNLATNNCASVCSRALNKGTNGAIPAYPIGSTPSNLSFTIQSAHREIGIMRVMPKQKYRN
jgi:hypothetical protein